MKLKFTHKFTTIKDGCKEINFIDFRNSEGKLPFVKFPVMCLIHKYYGRLRLLKR